MSGKPFIPNSIDEHIGQRLQLRRVMMGLSQKDLSQICGVTFQQIQKYECASNRISASRLFEIGVALDTPISFFFSGLPGHLEREPRNGRLPKNRVCDDDTSSFDPLSKTETLHLINLYWKLDDEKRELLMRLLKTLTVQE